MKSVKVSEKQVRIEIKRSFRSREEKRRFEAIMRTAISDADLRFTRGCDSPSLLRHGPTWIAEMENNELTLGRVMKCRKALERFARELRLDDDLLPMKRRFADEKPDVYLADITRRSLQAWINRRMRSVSASTANGELAILKTFAYWCQAEDLWSPDAQAMLWLRMPRRQHSVRQPDPVSPAEFVRMLQKLPKHISLPWLYLYLSGDRPGAIYALRWEHVHWPEEGRESLTGWVRLGKRKGGPQEAMDVPFVAGDAKFDLLVQARALFQEIKGRFPRSSDPIFISGRTGSPWTGPTFGRAIKYHLKKKGMKVQCPYLARHSVGTNLMRAGGTPYEAQAALGHRDGRTTQRYVHLIGQARGDSAVQIEEQISPYIKALLNPVEGKK